MSSSRPEKPACQESLWDDDPIEDSSQAQSPPGTSRPAGGKSAYLRAVGMLAKRAHSGWELRRKLKRFHSTGEIEKAIEKLEHLGFLDDAQFAAQRASLCRLDKAWGERRIELDLRGHQVKGKALAAALEAAETEQSEKEALERIVENWLRLRGEPSNVRDLKKLHDRCLRLGHRPDRVRARLDVFFQRLDWDAH